LAPDEGVDGDNRVATRAVLHHDRLVSSAMVSPLGEKPRPDVGTAAGPERHDELDGALGLVEGDWRTRKQRAE